MNSRRTADQDIPNPDRRRQRADSRTDLLVRQLPQAVAQNLVPRPARSIPHRLAVGLHQAARPALAYLVGCQEMSDSLALGGGRQSFCQKVLERHVVEHGVRQQPASVSRSHPRAPSAAWPPTPQGRRTWPSTCRTGAADPMNAAHLGGRDSRFLLRNIPMICSSVNRDRFIVRSLLRNRTLAPSRGNPLGHSNPNLRHLRRFREPFY